MDIKGLSGAYGAKPYKPSVVNNKKAAPEKSVVNQKEQLELSSTSQSLHKVRETLNELLEIRMWDEKYNLWPMWESELLKNKELTQNPGWGNF